MTSGGKFAKQMATALEIPFSPIAGGWFGYYLDDYFKTNLVFTLVFGFLGFCHSILVIVRIRRDMTPSRG